MDSEKIVEMQVDHHLSGRYTLKERSPGTVIWTDVNESVLLGNTDPGIFYRAVAKRMASHSSQGTVVVSYVDDTAP